jgi:hypothetical protein
MRYVLQVLTIQRHLTDFITSLKLQSLCYHVYKEAFNGTLLTGI